MLYAKTADKYACVLVQLLVTDKKEPKFIVTLYWIHAVKSYTSVFMIFISCMNFITGRACFNTEKGAV